MNSRNLLICIVLLYVIIPSAFAFQASCYGRWYGVGDINTEESANAANNVLNNLGYDSHFFNDNDAVFALDRLENDNIF